ncbi:hypothetical protein [Paracoccus yeei]|jgi:hypothetical protein|uniref:hypothetical protein n=1 Tax=Paracoccus yeei TaxID=147645 RepID=UPI003BF86257
MPDAPIADAVFADPSALGPVHVDAFRATGVTVLGPPALNAALHRALLEEALRQLDAESWQLTGSRDRGEIAQDNRRAHLGPVARGYLSSDAVGAWLHALTGERLAPSWSATCYTRYTGPSEHMGEHCDKADSCKYNLLTYLDAAWPDGVEPSPGMQLFIFRGDNSATGLAMRLTARSNRAAAIFGSRHAHLRPPLAAGERLVMLAGCFHVAG